MKRSGATAAYDRDEIFRAAEVFRSRRRIRKAIREYERILSVDPRDADVHIRIAPLYIRAGRKDQAKASLREAVAWYEKNGFVEKAIAALRLSLSVDRRGLAAYLHLADLYAGKDHAGDALQLLRGARRCFRGRRYLNEAVTIEERILRLAPDDFRAQISLVRLLWKVGRRRAALERLGRMEDQWARRGNRSNWRKTRWLLCRFAPSPGTGWRCIVSLFSAPAPHRPANAR